MDVVALLPPGALEREHDYVERTAVGGGGNLKVFIDVATLLQGFKEGALRSHLPGTPARIEVGQIGAVVWSGDGVKSLAASGTIQLLQVIAGDQPSHAEGHDGELGVLAPLRLNEIAELSCHGLEALATVHRLEGGLETFVTGGHNGLAEWLHADAGVKNTVQENDLTLGHRARFGGEMVLRLEGGSAAGNHEDGQGEEKDGEDGLQGCSPATGGAPGGCFRAALFRGECAGERAGGEDQHVGKAGGLIITEELVEPFRPVARRVLSVVSVRSR